jgi:hypothetical protein
MDDFVSRAKFDTSDRVAAVWVAFMATWTFGGILTSLAWSAIDPKSAVAAAEIAGALLVFGSSGFLSGMIFTLYLAFAGRHFGARAVNIVSRAVVGAVGGLAFPLIERFLQLEGAAPSSRDFGGPIVFAVLGAIAGASMPRVSAAIRKRSSAFDNGSEFAP